jgi:hypothetical protein
MNGARFDFSALDPARDVDRWERLVDSVATRAWNARRRRLTVSFQVVSWARPVLAIAASIALVSWAASWPSGSKTAVIDGDSAAALARWAAGYDLPPTLEMLQVLGGTDGAD